MRSSSWIRSFLIAAALASGPSAGAPALAADPPGYDLREIGAPAGFTTQAFAISDAGSVVGQAAAEAREPVPFVSSPEHGFQFLPLPRGAASGRATGVNDHDRIVGGVSVGDDAIPAAWRLRGARWQFQRLRSHRGWEQAVAYRTNGAGQTVGTAVDRDGRRRLALWTAAGQPVDLGLPEGASEAFATGINGLGAITLGWLDEEGLTHGALWVPESANGRRGIFVPVEIPGAIGALPLDLNILEEVVGQAEFEDGTTLGFSWKEGETTFLGDDGSAATAVNDWGDRAGHVTTPFGRAAVVFRADGTLVFVEDPPSEPAEGAADINRLGALVINIGDEENGHVGVAETECCTLYLIVDPMSPLRGKELQAPDCVNVDGFDLDLEEVRGRITEKAGPPPHHVFTEEGTDDEVRVVCLDKVPLYVRQLGSAVKGNRLALDFHLSLDDPWKDEDLDDVRKRLGIAIGLLEAARERVMADPDLGPQAKKRLLDLIDLALELERRARAMVSRDRNPTPPRLTVGERVRAALTVKRDVFDKAVELTGVH